MTKKKKEIWTELELKGLLEDEDACVYWEKVQKHLSLHPLQLKNNTVALNEMLTTTLNFYDSKLDGFPLLYQNPKLVTDLGEQISDICYIHIDIEVEYYIFRPAVGKQLKGIVTKKAINHIRVLVHRAFSVAIKKPPNSTDWVGDKVRVGQEIKFTVTHKDYEFKYPVFNGTLDPETYLDGCQVFDESKFDQADEKVQETTPKKGKKKKMVGTENYDDPSESVEPTNIPKPKKIKLEKVLKSENATKVQNSNSPNQEEPAEKLLKSPKKKSKRNNEEDSIESKAELKKYKKQLQESLPDLAINNTEQSEPEKKKKKKKRDRSKDRDASMEEPNSSAAVDNSVPESSQISEDKSNQQLQAETSLNQEEESITRKKEKKKKKEKLSQDSDTTSETEKEYKKKLKKQLLVEAANQETQKEIVEEEEQVEKKKSKKKKTVEQEEESTTEICHSETEKSYKKKLHKGLFNSTTTDVENTTNPEESEAEKKSKKELQNHLFKSPKKSPKKAKKSKNLDPPIPQAVSYPDSDDSCFSDNKEKMRKYKKALRKSLAIDDETEPEKSPKKNSNKRKLNDSSETPGGKVQVDNNRQPTFLTPKQEDAKSSKKPTEKLNGLNSLCFEDRLPNDLVKPNQTLTPPSSDSDNVTIRKPSKKSKKVSSPSKVGGKTESGTTRHIKKEKD